MHIGDEQLHKVQDDINSKQCWHVCTCVRLKVHADVEPPGPFPADKGPGDEAS